MVAGDSAGGTGAIPPSCQHLAARGPSPTGASLPLRSSPLPQGPLAPPRRVWDSGRQGFLTRKGSPRFHGPGGGEQCPFEDLGHPFGTQPGERRLWCPCLSAQGPACPTVLNICSDRGRTHVTRTSRPLSARLAGITLITRYRPRCPSAELFQTLHPLDATPDTDWHPQFSSPLLMPSSSREWNHAESVLLRPGSLGTTSAGPVPTPAPQFSSPFGSRGLVLRACVLHPHPSVDGHAGCFRRLLP